MTDDVISIVPMLEARERIRRRRREIIKRSSLAISIVIKVMREEGIASDDIAFLLTRAAQRMEEEP